MQPHDYNVDPVCDFIYDISGKGWETILAHYQNCFLCQQETEEDFESYKEWGEEWNGYKIPPGIESAEEYLKAWYRMRTCIGDEIDTITESLFLKLESKNVQTAIRKLREAETRLIMTIDHPVADMMMRESLCKKLRILHALLGQNEFVYYMTAGCDLPQHHDLLEKLINFWRKTKVEKV